MTNDGTANRGHESATDPHGDALLEPVEPFTDAHDFGGDGSTQDEPLMEQNRASTDDRIAGILEQTAADIGDHPVEDIAEALRQRFGDSGIEVPDAELDRMAASLARTAEDLPEGAFEEYREQVESE